MRGIEKHLKEFENAGVRPVGISVDAPAESAKLCNRAGYTYPFLSDVGASVIRRYNILHPGAGENGKDIARPAEFLVDSSGIVRWVNLTNDFRIRATPEQMLSAIQNLH